MKPQHLNLISAKEASTRLGISRASLYAYVSRGLVRSLSSPTEPRERLYALDDVEALVRRRTRLRRPAVAAATALDWGLPVLETNITHIREGRLFYRNVEAVSLAETATLEETAGLLIGIEPADRASCPAIGAAPRPRSEDFITRAIHRLSIQEGKSDDPASQIAGILSAMVEAGSGSDPGGSSFHHHLAIAWHAPPAEDAIRRALVLCADHELSASAFAVRVAASTGAALHLAVIVGLAALSGPRHGGATNHARDFLEECTANGRDWLDARLKSGEPISGFHHPLYPAGDPRGQAILKGLPLRESDAAILGMVEEIKGWQPTVDMALVMLERAYSLPEGAAFILFATGRTAGWLAHAVEQRNQGSLIRPRARYVVAGEPP